MKGPFKTEGLDEQEKYLWLECEHYNGKKCNIHCDYKRMAHTRCLGCKDFSYRKNKDGNTYLENETTFCGVE